MTAIQIINIIVVLCLPIMFSFGQWMYQYLVQRMPMHQRAALEQFARMAVQHVEQNHADSIDKKALAHAFASDLFGAFQLPVPSQTALDTAIGSAMFEASSASEREKSGPKKQDG